MTGGQVHAGMQWHKLTGAWEPVNASGSSWDGERPLRGCLERSDLNALCDTIKSVAGECPLTYFAFWDGWAAIKVSKERGTASVPIGKRRSYVLYVGRLQPFALDGQSPNLMWSEDQSWCTATEVDLDSTVLGGSDELVKKLVLASDLECWELSRDARLAYDGDTVN